MQCQVARRSGVYGLGRGMDGDGEKAGVGGLGDWQGVATQRFAA